MAERHPGILVDHIVEALEAELHGSGDVMLTGVSNLELAGPGDLSFVTADRFIEAAKHSRASALLIHRFVPELPQVQLVVSNPMYAFTKAVEPLLQRRTQPRGISDTLEKGRDVQIGPDCSIWPFVTMGDRVRIGARTTLYPGVFLGDDAEVGADSMLHPNVYVGERCTIGDRVIIHSGTVIGSDWFGYVPHEGRHQKIPQLGRVVIEDDVELGANVTVDRATFGNTVIGQGTKVDNLVQIAHNVHIGPHSILVAQVGIAGSTTIGQHVMIGGQAGICDHLDIGDGARVAARSGVARRVEPGQTVSGSPALPHDTSTKVHTALFRLPAIHEKVLDLEKRIKALEAPAAATKPKRPRRSH